MKTDVLRAEVEGYGGRIEVVSESWVRIDVDRTNTRVEVMQDGGRFLIKGVGRVGTIADVLGLLTAAGE